MRAAFYTQQGAAASVLHVGKLPDPTPHAGEVRVRVRFSGISPGDTKKRAGWLGSSMAYPLVIPHSDGAGVIDQVGDGVDASRVSERVWVYGAQSYRAFGTAAEYVIVPSQMAVTLPSSISDEVGACLGIPGITAHRAVFGDGPVTGKTVLVHGVLGAVGSLARQLAIWGGARAIGTVRRAADAASVLGGEGPIVALDGANPAPAILEVAPGGVDRIVEVSFSDNAALDAEVVSNDGVIAAYASRNPQPSFDFWPMLFNNVTIRLLGSDDFPEHAKRAAATDLTSAASEGALQIATGDPFGLDRIASAHDQVDADNRRRVLLRMAD